MGQTSDASTMRRALPLLVRQFKGPLVLILLVGAAVSLWLREWTEAALIGLIVLLSAGLSFWQELGALRALQALKAQLAITARVRRGDQWVTVPVDAVVPGDEVDLRAGDRIPGDGVVLASSHLQVNQASLTGESVPVDKLARGDDRSDPDDAQAATPIGTPLHDDHALFAGTSVHSGTARMRVLRTGADTELARLSAHLSLPDEETDFERGVRHFGAMLLQVMLVVVIAVLVVNQLQGRAVVDSLLFAVALAVGLSPEMLPAIVTLSLARSAMRLSREGVLVRRLDAIEDLGGMQVLLTDKTGTLTTGQLSLVLAADAQGQTSDEVLRLAWLNARFETGIDNPIDAAVLQAGAQKGLNAEGWHKLAELPYDFQRRRLSVLLHEGPGHGMPLMITKGAVREVLAVCDIADAQRDAALAWAQQQGEQGRRVLAVAMRPVETPTDMPANMPANMPDEAHLQLAGFVVFDDPVQPDAAQAVHELARHGIRVVMVTGDSRHVAARVAREVGLHVGTLGATHLDSGTSEGVGVGAGATDTAVVTGEELSRISDDALWHRIAHTACFAEVLPEQKERIVRALQRHGRSVGFLGDGINDAAALRAADVGISVQGAVDVARESADLVLLQPGLQVLRRGVQQGRRTFANTLKYIQFTLSANFGNMLSMALATPWLPFLPLTAGQILLNNFLSDLPALALAADRVDSAAIRRARRWKVQQVRRFMWTFGLLSSLFDLLTFALLLWVFATPQPLFHAAWFLVSLLTEVGMLLLLRTREPLWRNRPGPWLAAMSALVVALALALVTVPALAHPLGFDPLPWPLLCTLLGVVGACLVVTEAAKRRLLARTQSHPPGASQNEAHGTLRHSLSSTSSTPSV